MEDLATTPRLNRPLLSLGLSDGINVYNITNKYDGINVI